jgi:hypothetical protein
MNGGIGRLVTPNSELERNPYVKKVEKGAKFEYLWQGRTCFVIITVDKESMRITAWRYGGDPAPCWRPTQSY